MNGRTARHLLETNKLALGLAAGTSAALCAAAITGHDLNAVEVVGAFALAGAVGAISVRSSRPQPRQPHVLKTLDETSEGPVVLAPKASTLVAQPTHHSDAA